MARSHRAAPVRGITTSESEKRDKQAAHRRERRRIHAVVHTEPETEVMPHARELSDPWTMAKDGKMRFDPTKHPHLMRK
jgi:hypothetical protein